MARRQKLTFLDELLRSPWWISAGLAAAGYGFFQWFIPAVTANNPMFHVAAQSTRSLSVPVGGFFALVALIVFIKQRHEAAQSVSNVAPLFSRKAITPKPSFGVSNVPSIQPATTQPAEPIAVKPEAWSLELLQRIEWKRVEELTAAYFREKTFRTETIAGGPDGGIDVKLFVRDNTEPFAIVQCKAWNTQRVGVKPVRELLGVMAHEKVKKGIFVTTSDYTPDAVDFAKLNPINLISGAMLFKGISALPTDAQQRLLLVATEGDYLTPTCPSCGVKMQQRSSNRGEFWGCRNYPRCKSKFAMRVA